MIIRKFSLLKRFAYNILRKDPWRKEIYLEDCCSNNSLRLLIVTTVLLSLVAVPQLIVPAWRETLSWVGFNVILAASLTFFIWLPFSIRLSKKKFNTIVKAIERSDDGLVYLEARVEYESLQRLAAHNGGSRLYEKQLDHLRQKVIKLWQAAIDNSGLAHQLCSEPEVSYESPQPEPAILEAIAEADQRLDEKLDLHRISRQEAEQLTA